MGKITWRFIISMLVILLIESNNDIVSAQNVKTETFPVIELQLLDSSTTFQTKSIRTGMPVVFLLFNTTCEHCQNQAGDLVRNKEKLKKLQLIMISIESITVVKAFYQKYSLSQIEGLVIGKDYRFGGANYFMYESFPFCAIYSKKHQYLNSFERNFTTDTIFKELKKNKEL